MKIIITPFTSTSSLSYDKRKDIIIVKNFNSKGLVSCHGIAGFVIDFILHKINK
jgi:hypothetical protein